MAYLDKFGERKGMENWYDYIIIPKNKNTKK